MQEIPARNKKMISDIGLYGSFAKGRKELLLHLNGKRLSPLQSILAKCYQCTCYYADGREDCGMQHCALHLHMHYNPSKSKRKATGKQGSNLRGKGSRTRAAKKK